MALLGLTEMMTWPEEDLSLPPLFWRQVCPCSWQQRAPIAHLSFTSLLLQSVRLALRECQNTAHTLTRIHRSTHRQTLHSAAFLSPCHEGRVSRYSLRLDLWQMMICNWQHFFFYSVVSPQTQYFSSRKSGLTEVRYGRSSPLTAHPDPEQGKTMVGSLGVFLLERLGQVVSCSAALDFFRGSLLSEQGQTQDRMFSVMASGDTSCITVICLFFF